jgi:O-Antigen ligase
MTMPGHSTRPSSILHVYALLFCLTIIALNPVALFRGNIWTQPKIFCVAGIVVVHIGLLLVRRSSLPLTRQWLCQALGWCIFLIFGLISTLASPFPARSFWGHGITAAHPHLFYWQLRGILVGAVLVALSMYPQLLNWKIDYTIHSGQMWPGTSHVLATAVYQNHQPIGLYSHRGYAGFTLAMGAVLGIVSLKNQWLSKRVALYVSLLCAMTLSLAGVRGALLAMLAGWLWLVLTSPQSQLIRRMFIALSLIGLLSFGWVTVERRVGDSEIYASTRMEAVVRHFTSDRVYLWRKAWKGFLKRPWLGWGFSDYSMVDATFLCPEVTSPIALADYFVYCQMSSGEIIEKPAEAIKAHNLVLDEYVSLGILGASSYFLLVLLMLSVSPTPTQQYWHFSQFI